MHFENHPDATQELRSAAIWYAAQDSALARDFLAEFRSVIEKIRRFPSTPSLYAGKFRKVRFRRFPYAVVYDIKQDSVVIIAVMHLHRRPFYWISRASR